MGLSDWTYYNRAAGSQPGPPYGNKVFAESEDSGYFHIGDDDSSATNNYFVDYGQILNFVDALKGYPTFNDEAGGDYGISRELPHQHPLFQKFWCAEADGKTMSVTGVETTTNGFAGLWKQAAVQAVYRPLDYDVIADNMLPTVGFTDPLTQNYYKVPDEKFRFVTRNFNFVLQTISNKSKMKYVQRTMNKLLDTSPSSQYAYLEMEMVWHSVPARTVGYSPFIPPNSKTALACGATLNTSQFDTIFNPNTVLFVGYAPRLRKPNLDTGLYTWDIVYRFVVADHGFSNELQQQLGPNTIYDTDFGRWDLITSDGTTDGNTLYQFTDHNSLFSFQQFA